MHAACRHAAVQAHLRMPCGCSARTVPQHDPPPQRSGSPPARGGAHSAGGLGLIYTFIDGDRVIEDVGALIDFSFRTQGDQLVMTIDGSDAALTVSVDGNAMEIRSGGKTRRRRAVIAR
jgi:hypothetical protein